MSTRPLSKYTGFRLLWQHPKKPPVQFTQVAFGTGDTLISSLQIYTRRKTDRQQCLLAKGERVQRWPGAPGMGVSFPAFQSSPSSFRRKAVTKAAMIVTMNDTSGLSITYPFRALFVSVHMSVLGGGLTYSPFGVLKKVKTINMAIALVPKSRPNPR